jgi:ADP-heptose:LPS heptosyltransferase
MIKQKFAGFNMQLIGDIIMNTVAARSHKELYPDSHFTLCVANKYSDMELLFKNHPYIDDFHVYEGYDGVTKNDIQWLKDNKFNHVYNPMPQHKYFNWWLNPNIKNQTAEVCDMHDLSIPNNLQCYLEKWFDITDNKDCISIYPFTNGKEKNLSNNKWQQIIDYINSKGFNVIQLGAKNEFQFEYTFKPNLNYFESTKLMLGTKFTLGLDSSCAWLSSSYSHPFLGLYSYLYPYQGLTTSKIYQPINNTATYLESDKVENIPNELIFSKIDEMIEKYK